nr:flagellar hook-length control protein FliK [Vicinamibacterales bacterium]
ERDVRDARRQAVEPLLEALHGAGAEGAMRRSTLSTSARMAIDTAFGIERGAPPAGQGVPPTATAPVVLDHLDARFQAWLASAAAPSEAPGAAGADEAPDVPAQVVKAIHLQWRDGLGEARVQLRPEHLGAVTVSLRVEQGHVVASVRADSPVAAEIIRARQPELQAALTAQGLELDDFVVTLDPDDRRDRPAYQPEPPRPPRRGEPGARFEVIA